MGDSPEERRPKRQKRETSYKSKAFEKFKQLKSGARKKYEVEELESVYETVDESEYTKRVLDRQDDDWIVDDDGSGYVEDGRDIFDDDMDSESIAKASKMGKGLKRKKKAVSDQSGKGNLQYMLSNMPTKKKQEVKLEDDDMLSEILGEINETPSSSSITNKTKKPAEKTVFVPRKQIANDYLKNFSLPPKKVVPVVSKPSTSGVSSNGNSSFVNRNLKSSSNGVVKSEIKKPAIGGDKVNGENMDIDLILDETQDIKPKSLKQKSSETSTTSKSSGFTESENLTIEEDDSQDIFGDDDFDLAHIEEFESQHAQKMLLKNSQETTSQVDSGIVKTDTSEVTQNLEGKIPQNGGLDAEDIDANLLEDIEKEFSCEWDSTFQDTKNEIDEGISMDKYDLPLINVEDKKVFRFFWWDAYEDSEKQKGTVFLFGKTYCETARNYVSCCVAVRNINRKLFILPRPYELDNNGEPTDKPVSHKDVYTEFNETVIKPLRISAFRTRFVQKKYAFNPEIPVESEYMEIQYPATDPKINLFQLNQKPKTFSKIFGLNTSHLETFLLDRKIKGPCWLDVVDPVPVGNPISWCKFEVNCQKMINISVTKTDRNIPPPPLVVASLNFRYYMNPKTYNNEIVMISCVSHTRYAVDKQTPNPPFTQHFCVFSNPSLQVLPLDIHDALKRYTATKVQKMNSEKALLNYFILQFSKLDPDLIVGHDLLGYQMNVLSNRLVKHDVKNFSQLGRLKRSEKRKLEKEVFVGRLVCDLKISAKELIKSRSYDLDALCQSVLKMKENERMELEPEEIPKMFVHSENITKLISVTMHDSALILKMMYDLNVIPLALQITNIAGNVMSRTLMGGRSERNEFLLLHAFSEKDYIVPDKEFKKKEDVGERSQAARKKPTYSGGLVLEPKVGFYDKLILLMDFNSLYPSIIQEYNICFTTLPVTNTEDNMILPDKNLQPGILPTEIRKLVESRRQVKNLMNNPDISNDLRMQYHIRQMALKLTANSMYGCLGFSNSRFYAKNLAALVTHKGREILTNTKDLVEKMAYEVVYGDTDSIMINTNILNYDEVFKIGNKIKQEINRLYKQVELDIDGVFKYLLLLKKKKYAAVTLSKTKDGKVKEAKEYKGLDIVRRDWSQLASEAGKFILEHILSDQSSDDRISNIHAYLAKVREDLENGRVPIQLLLITKQLTKDPRMYADKNTLPHVQVALRYNQECGGHYRAGDTVSYLVCEDGTERAHTQRGYHPDEYKNPQKNLKIDVNYYLSQQIHPVVSRICEPIEGTDVFKIAECLGLDTSSFKKPKDRSAGDNFVENTRKPEIKFRDVDKFSFKCLGCKSENIVEGCFIGNLPFLEKCTNSTCNVRPVDYIGCIQNQLTVKIRSHISKYYQNKMTCEDPACTNETSRMPLRFAGKYPVCTSCHSGVMFRTYTERQLYTQLMYFMHIFDPSKQTKKPLLDEQIDYAYRALRDTVEKYLNHSGYSVVNLGELFDFILGKKTVKSIESVHVTQKSAVTDIEMDEYEYM